MSYFAHILVLALSKLRKSHKIRQPLVFDSRSGYAGSRGVSPSIWSRSLGRSSVMKTSR